MNNSNRIIVFANQKGGVGKSTLCILFADYLARLGYPVAVIDADSQQTVFRHRQRDLVDAGMDTNAVPWDVVPIRTNAAEVILNAINKARQFPGTILIDAPGNLENNNIAQIYANADYIITPITYHPDVVDSSAQFAEVLQKLKEQEHLQFITWFLPNRIDDRKKADMEQLKLNAWKTLHKNGDILTRINDRAYLERSSTLYLDSQQTGAVKYAFDRIITEIEENER